jgi:hypothetical protein
MINTFRNERTVVAVVVACACVFYAIFIWRGAVIRNGSTYFTLFDDAMISMRYAKNLAQGFGLTWNPSDTPIEGFTNPLWTLWMTGLHNVPVAEGWIPLLVSLSSACCLVGTAFAARDLAKELNADPNTSIVVMASVAFYYPLAFWSLRGMETGALAWLITLSTLLCLRQYREPTASRTLFLALLVSALLLIRLDSLIFVGLLIAFTIVASARRMWTTTASLIAATVLTLTIMTAIRWWYYGDFFPNTYYLKMTGVEPSERIRRGLRFYLSSNSQSHFGGMIFIVAMAAAIVPAIPVRRFFQYGLLLGVFGAQSAYSIYVGGDAWEWMGYPNRYLAPAIPCLLVLVLVLLKETLGVGEAYPSPTGRRPRLRAAVAATAIAALLFLQMNGSPLFFWIKSNGDHVDDDKNATLAGLCLREYTPPDARIAYVWAGTMPYYANRFAIDLLGKMDPVIARSKPHVPFFPGHNKWDYEYSIKRYKPNIIVQLWKPEPKDFDIIRSLGFASAEPSWPCIQNVMISETLKKM